MEDDVKESIGDVEIQKPATAVEPKKRAPAEPESEGYSSLATLSEGERAAWLKNSEAPERLGKPEKPPKTLDEGQRVLAGLNEETREKWLSGEIESGELVAKQRGKDAEKAAEKAAESAGSEESAEPAAPPQKHVLLGEHISDRDHQAAQAGFRDRYQRDQAESGGDAAAREVADAAAKITSQHPVYNFLAVALPHMQRPFKFWKEVVLNPVFRAQIESSDAKSVVKIMADFDRKGSAESEEDRALAEIRERKVTRAPAPGQRGAGGGKRIAPRDPVEAALASGDFSAYFAAANAREAGR
jgi:hypothetical protein